MAVETRVVRITNLDACPLPEPVDETPNPQFAGAIVCVQSPVRTLATTKQRKQDVNPDSPTFNQWQKEDLSYDPLEANGFYFPTGDTDAVLCPLGCYFTYEIISEEVPPEEPSQWSVNVFLWSDLGATTPATAPEDIDFDFTVLIVTIPMGDQDASASGILSSPSFAGVDPSYYTDIT